MTSIDLTSIVRKVGINIVSASQILLPNIYFYPFFCEIQRFLTIRFYTAPIYLIRFYRVYIMKDYSGLSFFKT